MVTASRAGLTVLGKPQHLGVAENVKLGNYLYKRLSNGLNISMIHRSLSSPKCIVDLSRASPCLAPKSCLGRLKGLKKLAQQ